MGVCYREHNFFVIYTIIVFTKKKKYFTILIKKYRSRIEQIDCSRRTSIANWKKRVLYNSAA